MARVTVDQGFSQLTSSLFGDLVDAEGLWAEVSKMNPGPSDVHAPGALPSTRGPRRSPGGALVVRRRVSKKQLTPEQREKRERLERNIARTSNVVGLGAGALALNDAARSPKLRGQIGHPVGGQAPEILTRRGKRYAAAALGAQALNVGGDIVTTRVLGRDAKKSTVDKAFGDLVNGALLNLRRLTGSATGKHAAGAPKHAAPKPEILQPKHAKPAAGPKHAATKAPKGKHAVGAPKVASSTADARAAGQARAAGYTQAGQRAKQDWSTFTGTTSGKVAIGAGAATVGGALLRRRQGGGGGGDPYAYYGKRDSVEAEVGFSKFDDDQRLAFGWASIVKKNGLPVVDRQGDYIDPEDLENAAYVYVEKSRVGGHMHKRAMGKDDSDDTPHHVADLVESMVFTPEKIAKMGLPDDFPVGWWVGFRVFDDDVWAKAKSGDLTGFSVHGKGIRKGIDYDALMGA